MSGRHEIRRVLVVTKSDGVGGVERSLTWFVPGMSRIDVDVDVVVLHDPHNGPGPLATLRPEMLGNGRTGPIALIRRVIALRSIAPKYDAVISTGPEANLIVCLGAAGITRTIISEQNDPFIERRRSWNRRWGWAMRRAGGVTAHTEALADELRASKRYPRIVTVIPHAANPGIEPGDPTDRRDRVVCGVGRLVPQKGYEVLIEAFASLGDRADGWSLLLVGDGPERKDLEALAEELGIADRCTVTGMVAEPWRSIDRASVFALCSRHEGFGIVILEAMAAGCAVVVSDCRFGPREIVRDGVDGLVVATGDVDALTDALAKLMADDRRRERLALAGQRRLEDYSVESVIDRWMAMIRDVPDPTSRH